MDNTKRLFQRIAAVLAASIIGAILTMGFEVGARWMQFILYVFFFASISSPALFSSRFSCSDMLHPLRKQR